MLDVKKALRRLWETPEQPHKAAKKPLSRQDVLWLMAADKLSAAQAEAVIRKRFKAE